MRFYTSYFYQIRFFKPYMFPISTAIWDPRWFHDFKSQAHIFKDKNGVINGLRADVMAPGAGCANDCRGLETCVVKDPSKCAFLHHYREQLDTINFDDFIAHLTNFAQTQNLMQEPIIVFIVHEAKDNPCSERKVIQEWLRAHGIDAQELDPLHFE